MFCNNCGSELKDGARFCIQCGKEVITENAEILQKEQKIEAQQVQAQSVENIPLQQNVKKGKSKAKVIIITVLVSVFILLLGGIGIYISSPVYEIQKAIKSDDADAIVSEYNIYVDGEFIWELLSNNKIEGYMLDLVDGYKAEKQGYEEIREILDTLREIDDKELSDIAQKLLYDLDNYHTSYLAITSADRYMEEKNYVAAIGIYDVLQDNEDFGEEAKEKLETAKAEYKESVLKETENLETLEEYEVAIEILDTAVLLLVNDDEINDRRDEVNVAYLALVKQYAIDEATKAIADEDYEKAFKILSEAVEKVPNDNQLNELLITVVQSYEGNIIALVDTYLTEKKYNDAIALINAALKVMPDSEVLKEKLADVEEKKPVSLTTFTPINGSFKWNEGNPMDPFGNTYNDAVNYAIFEYVSKYGKDIEYRVYGDYVTFNFSVAPYSNISEDGTAYVQIYADDVLVFTSDTINRKTDMKTYSVNITNAEYIKIVVKSDDNFTWNNAIILLNCTLQK